MVVVVVLVMVAVVVVVVVAVVMVVVVVVDVGACRALIPSPSHRFFGMLSVRWCCVRPSIACVHVRVRNVSYLCCLSTDRRAGVCLCVCVCVCVRDQGPALQAVSAAAAPDVVVKAISTMARDLSLSDNHKAAFVATYLGPTVAALRAGVARAPSPALLELCKVLVMAHGAGREAAFDALLGSMAEAVVPLVGAWMQSPAAGGGGGAAGWCR